MKINQLGHVKLEILGLALDGGKQLIWVDEDVFDRRKHQVSTFAEPRTNLGYSPEKIKKLAKKMKENPERYGKKVVFAKKEVEFDLSTVYEGNAKITRVNPNSIDVEEIGGEGRYGHVYYSYTNPGYLNEDEIGVSPEEAMEIANAYAQNQTEKEEGRK